MPVLRDLRYRLQQRRDNLLRVDYNRYTTNLHYFMNYILENPLLKGISDELKTYEKDITPANEWIETLRTKRSAPLHRDETINACFCQSMIEHVLGLDTRGLRDLFNTITAKHQLPEQLNEFNEVFLKPFYHFIDERIDDFDSKLYLLQKYRYSCEWFERKRLYNLYKNDESKGETNLDQDLRKFLYLQGIDYPFSSPLSPSGRADVVAELNTDHPLVLETKIFDLNKGYDKAYIRKGFRQAYDYSNDYNEPIGYLFIFKTCEHDLIFDLKDNSLPHKIIFGIKTIFLIQTDIYVYDKSASERKKLNPYIIEEKYLISSE